ncbi:ureidoglycolate lyase [Achromobacter denitrificans]
MNVDSARRVVAEPLTSEGFAAFGEVVEHAGEQRRRHLSLPFAHAAPACRPAMWVSRVEAAIAWPCPVVLLERHPYSSQTFIPLDGASYLVAVAPDGERGEPDLSRLRAFIASGSQGVLPGRGLAPGPVGAARAGPVRRRHDAGGRRRRRIPEGGRVRGHRAARL